MSNIGTHTKPVVINLLSTVLQPFNTVPHVVMTSKPQNISLLLYKVIKLLL